MNNVVKGIASAMIIILIILLIWIFLAYYRNTTFVDTIVYPNTDTPNINIPSGDYVSEGEHDIENGLIESIIGTKDAEKDNEVPSGDAENNEDKSTSPIDEVKPPKKDSSEQIIISSNTETSNQQKQEILTEIDEALQGLLEAVGKVETVDENRLDATLDSEVVEP